MKFLLLASVLTVSVGLLPSAGISQDAAWLIGTWKGEHSARSVRFDNTTITFRQDGPDVAWKLERTYDWEGGGRRELEGAGKVTKATDSQIELTGKYTTHPDPQGRGAPISYSLSRSEPDVLKGFLFGAQGVRVDVTLKKVK